MRIRTKPWAKAVACILFVLSITSVLVTILPVNRLVYDGAYQSGGRETALENNEENLAMDLTHQLTDIYVNERMGPTPPPTLWRSSLETPTSSLPSRTLRARPSRPAASWEITASGMSWIPP